MIVYKLVYHSNDKCVLMISDSLVDKVPDYIKLNYFFERIIVYPISLPIDSPESNISERSSLFFENVFKSNKCNIKSFLKIYVGCAHYYFGIYLASNNIPFVFFEDAAGIKSHPEILINIEKEKYPQKQLVNLQLGLYDGTAKCIEKVVCNHNAQQNHDVIESTEHFDVVENFIQLPNEIQQQIIGIFTNVKKFDIPSNSILLLTQHFTNLKILSFEDQVLIYQTVVDYFFSSDNVLFKPHPDDIMYYGLLFPESKVIREKFPAEFLPIMFNNKPKTIATISSTSIYNLQNYFDNSFCLGVRFEKDFKALHRYYTALTLYKQLGVKCPIVGIGDNEPVVNELCKAENISVGNGKGRFYIVDDIETNEEYDRKAIINLTESLDTDSAVVFINFRQDFCFYDINHKQLWNNIVPICIQKKQLSDDEFYADTSTEVVYFYSNNEELRKMAQELNFTKVLDHTGMEISIEKLTPEQKQIKVLEGILEATEKRLLYYMNLVEEKKG